MTPLLNLSALRSYHPIRLDRPELERAAVLIPIVRRDNGDQVLFTARHSHLRFQPGHISFPGGKVEPGETDFSSCALREAEEEISLPPAQVEVIAEMDHVVVSSCYVVAPFAGLVAPDAPITPGVAEVAKVIVVNVSELLVPELLGEITYMQDGVSKQAYKFTVGDVTIWGATARILRRFLEIGYGAQFPASSF